MHTCGELLYSFAFGHYSSYAKAAELKKTLVVEQFGKEPDLARLSTRSPGREGMPAKIPAVQAGAAAGASRGEKGGCERGGRWEGGKGCRTIRTPTSTSVGRRGPRCVCFVSFVRMVVHISQQTLKITDRVSVIPHTIEKG